MSNQTSEILENPTTANALAQRVNSNIDLVAAHMVEQINLIRVKCNEVEKLVLGRCDDAKNGVNSVAEMASTVQNLVSSSTETLAALLEPPVRRPNVRVIEGGNDGRDLDKATPEGV